MSDLSQMAIWSLTQERVERLHKHIGDKEDEIDALQRLTPKDLWTSDLDEFVTEWNTQLEDEGKRKKKIANLGRRDSRKLGIGAKGGKAGKRKKKNADSDSDSDEFSDYGPAKKKPKPKTSGLLGYLKKDPDEAVKKLEPAKSSTIKQTGLLGYLKKPLPALTQDAMDIDEPSVAPAAAVNRSRPATTKKATRPTPAPADSDSDSDSDVFAVIAKEDDRKKATTSVTNGRTGRGATKKTTNYAVDKDSDSDAMSDDDFDVSTMVKTIGASGNDRPLFSAHAARTSNARPSSATNGTSKPASRTKPVDSDDDMDETNYEALAQGSPEKPAARDLDGAMDLNDSDDDMLLSIKKKAPVKPVPKAKAAAKPKGSSASTVVAKKTMQLSPAAKAYAARLGKTRDVAPSKLVGTKGKKAITIDADTDTDGNDNDANQLVNDILSDDDDEVDMGEAIVQPKKTLAARPGRRAAAKPARYVVSDDDEDDDEPSEASFDDDSE